MTNKATAKPNKGPEAGDILYMDHKGMQHGTRPMACLGIADGHAMLLPLSHTPMKCMDTAWIAKDWKKHGCSAEGYWAPNKTHTCPISNLPAPAGKLTWDELMGAWDAYEGYAAYQQKKWG